MPIAYIDVPSILSVAKRVCVRRLMPFENPMVLESVEAQR